MAWIRHVVCAFLLACVVPALCDAPYVDEFFDDLNSASAGCVEAMVVACDVAPKHPDRTSGTSRICGDLLNLPAVPDQIRLPIVRASPGAFRVDLSRPFSSADPKRIDRPPSAYPA